MAKISCQLDEDDVANYIKWSDVVDHTAVAPVVQRLAVELAKYMPDPEMWRRVNGHVCIPCGEVAMPMGTTCAFVDILVAEHNNSIRRTRGLK